MLENYDYSTGMTTIEPTGFRIMKIRYRRRRSTDQTSGDHIPEAGKMLPEQQPGSPILDSGQELK